MEPEVEPSALAAALLTSSPDRITVVNEISWGSIGRVGLTVAAVTLVWQLWPVLVLILFSLMLVATFNPLVRKLQARTSRSGAIAAIVTLFVVVLLGTLILVVPVLLDQTVKFLRALPDLAAHTQAMLAAHHIHTDLEEQIQNFSQKLPATGGDLQHILLGVANGLTSVATVAILTIYLLLEGPVVATGLLRLIPREKRLGLRRLFGEIGLSVGNYMRGQILTSLMAGAFTGILLLAIGARSQALALGVLAAVADIIPLVGLLLALIPTVLAALALSTTKAVIALVALLIYHQIESHIIGPRIYGNALGLALSMIVISLLVGVQLMGMLGAILALPAAAAIPNVFAYISAWNDNRDEPAPRTTV